MYFHNSLIPRGAYFLLPLESKQEATSGWNFTKCMLEVKVNQLKVKNIYMSKWAYPLLNISFKKLSRLHLIPACRGLIVCDSDLTNQERKSLLYRNLIQKSCNLTIHLFWWLTQEPLYQYSTCLYSYECIFHAESKHYNKNFCFKHFWKALIVFTWY